MTHQEKIQYLNRYQEADAEINRTMEELCEWKCRATKVTAAISGMPRGGNGEDRLQAAVEKICDLESEMNRQIDGLVQIREEIVTAIETVGDAKLRTLLAYHYLNGTAIDAIADTLGYSYRHVTRLHRKALEELKVDLPCPSKSVILLD